MDELRGWQKSLAIVGMKSNCLVLSAIKHPLLGRGKRRLSLPAVTGYFVKMNPLPEKPSTDYICTIERFITEQASTYTNLDMARKHFLPKRFVR